jgi:hypothetical protein
LASVTPIRPSQPAPRRRRWRPLRVLLSTGVALACVSVVLSAAAPPVVHIVVLEVSGPATADVTYRVGDVLHRPGVVALPWQLPVQAGPGLRLVLVAQSTSGEAVTCRVGSRAAVTAEGLFAVAVCRR